MTLSQLLDIIDRASAWEFLKKNCMPGQVFCPICGAKITGRRALAAYDAGRLTYCRAHKSSFRPLAAVRQLRYTEWEPEQYVKFLILNECRMPVAEIAQILGKSRACIIDMCTRVSICDGEQTLATDRCEA